MITKSTDTSQIPPKPKSHWWRRWGERTFSAYLFLLPSLVIFITFTFFPAIYSMVVSLFRWNMPSEPYFIGLENYIYLFTDPIEGPLFWKSFLNTFYFALGVPINLVISLLIALLLNRRLTGVGIFRTTFFLPTITSMAAVSIVWMWLFHPAEYGPFQQLVDRPGFTYPKLAARSEPCHALPDSNGSLAWHGVQHHHISGWSAGNTTNILRSCQNRWGEPHYTISLCNLAFVGTHTFLCFDGSV